jgi:alkaline phosphatase
MIPASSAFHFFNSQSSTMKTGHFLVALAAISCTFASSAGETPAGWYRDGQMLVAERRSARDELPPARNLILFVGDGMSFATVAAARILEGQKRGESGESNLLYFERFPHTAFSKTYNTDRQTPDSAGTMTAMVTGVKTFAGALSVDQHARYGDCESAQGRELVTLLDIASLAGLATGVVTNTRITHATPAALYARTPHRRWESDAGMSKKALEAGCRDIARQLVEYDIGGGIDVVLGGGRREFMPDDSRDPEYPEQAGRRKDGRDLIGEWRERYSGGRYVWNLGQFREAVEQAELPLLGLFEPSHMQYEHDRLDDEAGEPSLTEMTRESIALLSGRSEAGYFLMVEGGRIDHAHHGNNAYRALTETIEFARAIEAAHEMTDPQETLIVVTADHGHAMVFAGYPARGNPITGLVRRPDADGKPGELQLDNEGRPMTTLRYFDGPAYRGDARPDYDQVDPRHPDFRQEAAIGLASATHSGEDVPVYATGPGAEVLHGVFEQNVIFHTLLQAHRDLLTLAEDLADQNGLPQWSTIRSRKVDQSP